MRVHLSRGGLALAEAETGSDGRIPQLGGDLAPGTYSLSFDCGAYFGAEAHLYERVTLEFTLVEGAGHHHVPLLLAPFAVSSYRGS